MRNPAGALQVFIPVSCFMLGRFFFSEKTTRDKASFGLDERA